MDSEEMGLDEPVKATPTFIEADTRGQIAIQMREARENPRSIVKFKKELLALATMDEETAEACFYVLPRAGKNIEGPGIRLAELVASCWGHMRVQGMVVDIGEDSVTARGVAWDIQKNNAQSMDVRRRITDRNGNRYNEDMINMTCNAAIKIATRNAIFSVVPQTYWLGAYEAAREVAVGNATTLVDRRARAIETFQKLGVQPKRLFEKFGIKGEEEITLEHLAELTGLRTAIKEGSATIDEVFPAEEKPIPARKSERASEGKVDQAAADKPEKSKKDQKEEKLEALRKYVEDSTDEEFLAGIETISDKCRGLSGEQFNKLVLAYSSRLGKLRP